MLGEHLCRWLLSFCFRLYESLVWRIKLTVIVFFFCAVLWKYSRLSGCCSLYLSVSSTRLATDTKLRFRVGHAAFISTAGWLWTESSSSAEQTCVVCLCLPALPLYSRAIQCATGFKRVRKVARARHLLAAANLTVSLSINLDPSSAGAAGGAVCWHHPPSSKKVQSGEFQCRLCVFSPCLRGFLPKIQKHAR